MIIKYLVRIKLLIVVLFFLRCFFANGQATNDTISTNGEYYPITEAYFIKNDTTYNINEEFIDQPSGIIFIPENDSSIIIGINHGSTEKTAYLGHGKKIINPGFLNTTENSEFYSWLYFTHGATESKLAYIHKEYVEGSLEKRGRKYFYFGIHFSDNSEYQFYTLKITKKSVEYNYNQIDK